MSVTRRSLFTLLPAAVAAPSLQASDPDFGKAALLSSIFYLKDAKVLGSPEDHYIPALDGSIHTAFNIKLHETELAPHAEADPPHKHRGEELFMVREGILQVEIAGKTSNIGPGDLAYVASNIEHATRNVSGEWVKYFALLLGSPKP